METDINVNRTGFVDFIILLRSNYFFFNLISPLKTKYHITDTKQISFLLFYYFFFLMEKICNSDFVR